MKIILIVIIILCIITLRWDILLLMAVVAIYFWLTKDKGGDGRPPMMRH